MTGTTTAPTAGTSTRVQWADVAKGACITLVVLLHVTTKHLVQLGDASRSMRDGWLAFTEWLRPIRMPLFFVISGLFAASSLRRPLQSVLRKRVIQSYYLYVLWLTVQTLAVDVWLRPYVESASRRGFVHALWLPTGNLWYLWALAVYFLVIAVVPVRFRPALAAVSAAACVAVAADWWDIGSRPTDLVQFSAFYAAGAVFPDAVRTMAVKVTPVSAAGVAAVFAVATVSVRHTEIGDAPFVTPVLYALGVWAGLGVAVMTRGRLADGLAELGRRTLPIYVMHVPLIMTWSWAIRRTGWRGWFPVEWAMWGYPVVLTSAAIVVALAVHALLQRLGAWWLFSLDRGR